MNPIRIALLALSLGAASCATVASETLEAPPALGQLESKTYLACMKKANGRLEQAPCIQKELAWQQDQLNRLYEALAKQLNDAQRAELTKSQSAWKAFIERESVFAQSAYDPQGLDFGVDENEIRWTAQRRQQLQRHLTITRLGK
ncbi:lysozyme inhibitor LprI family protein [Hydrogenophaga sp.]|uniref:lysozyme inhibitor LprI family protein n=1 Tax=Hydrogenophaga sp. TaxID=1904254 RepID=UPI0035B116AC